MAGSWALNAQGFERTKEKIGSKRSVVVEIFYCLSQLQRC